MSNMTYIHEGQAVYNPKMNYVRIYCDYSILDIARAETKEVLYNTFDLYKKLTDMGTKLVLDISTEGEDIKTVLEENNKEYILDWILDYTIDRNFKKNQLEIWVSDFNCKQNIGEKYSHLVRTVNQLHNFSPCTHDINQLENRIFDRKFICAMSRVSENRKQFYKWIVDSKIEDDFFYSYNAREKAVHPNDVYEPKLPLERYSNDNFSDSSRGEFATYKFQLKSIINIVSETIFENHQRVKFITEKTFRAISMAQPFIMLAQSNTLELLKSYGFKTFDRWWDESYDLEQDDSKRFELIKTIILELNKKNKEELSDMYKEMIPILVHNFENLFKLKDYYEFHPTYIFDKVDNYEFNVVDYMDNI